MLSTRVRPLADGPVWAVMAGVVTARGLILAVTWNVVYWLKYGGVASLWSSYARDESTRHRLRAQRMGTCGGWLLRVCPRCVAHFTL